MSATATKIDNQKETTEVKGDKSEFGPVKVDQKKAISVEAMMADFAKKGNAKTEYTVKGNITQVCAKMGCWVKIDNADGAPFMVRFTTILQFQRKRLQEHLQCFTEWLMWIQFRLIC